MGEPNWPNLPQMPPTQLLPKRRGQLAPTYAFARHLAIGVGMDGQRPCRTLAEDPGRTQPRAAYPRAAAQTRVVSLGGIRLRSWESARVFKGIICADVSEFESYMPSHAVASLRARQASWIELRFKSPLGPWSERASSSRATFAMISANCVAGRDQGRGIACAFGTPVHWGCNDSVVADYRRIPSGSRGGERAGARLGVRL